MTNEKWLRRKREKRAAHKKWWRLLSLSFIIFHFSFCPQGARAQFNTDRLINAGRSALYFEDYVLSIQYFNQVISAKPYLYESWFFRGVAKYYLDDFAGAEADCTEAIKRNPYVTNSYELRGLCRIQQQKFTDAVSDYTTALKYDPENQQLWHNRALCHIQEKDYGQALTEIDSMLTRWSSYARGYAMRAEVCLLQGDTTQAIAALDKSIEIDPYESSTWAARSIISLSRQEWKPSEEYLDKAIHLMPKQSGYYINRALARYNQSNLRGAMADYDTAIDLDPNSFLGHYNRGLLRAQVGDDNRGIEDFDFVLRLEPDNLMALFNRALLLEQTGDLHGAIRDYSKVIDEYPNFWFGLQHRAACYRLLGQSRQAEADEFRVLKAQIDKRYGGKQPRMKEHPMRKRSDDDPEKYNHLVVADEQEMEHEYKNAYRGRVQNRRVEANLLPVFELTFERRRSEVQRTVPFDRSVEAFNARSGGRPLYVYCNSENAPSTGYYLAYIDSLTAAIGRATATSDLSPLLMLRAVAYAQVRNFESAIEDLTTFLQADTTSVLGYWQRAVCQSKINDFQASEGTNIDMKTANVLLDLSRAITLSPLNAYLYYNRACLYARRKDYVHADEDYTQAIALDEHLAEAYYNRGVARVEAGRTEDGISDLSKAGELGLYDAYGLIKKYRKN